MFVIDHFRKNTPSLIDVNLVRTRPRRRNAPRQDRARHERAKQKERSALPPTGMPRPTWQGATQ